MGTHIAPAGPALEELDLAIPDMATIGLEQSVKRVLERMPGIRAVRLVPRGAWISYNPIGITKEEIINQVRKAGVRASEFQAT